MLESDISDKENTATIPDQKTEKKQNQPDGLEAKTAVVKKEAAVVDEIADMVKPSLLGGNLQISKRYLTLPKRV